MGTTMMSVAQIVESNFSLSHAGSMHGIFHGAGLYFAHQSSQSHAYAAGETLAGNDTTVHSMLICRVACGNMAPPGTQVSGRPEDAVHSIMAPSPSGADEIVVF